MMWMAMAIALIISSVTGWSLVHLLWSGDLRRENFVFRLSLAVALGLGVHSALCFVWLSLSLIPAALWAMDIVAMLLSLVIWFTLRRKRAADGPTPNLGEITEKTNAPKIFNVAWLMHGMLLLVIAVMGLAAWGDALRRPHGWWDAWSFWNMKARFFFRGGELWARALTEASATSHTDYPLLLPLNLCRLWVYIGHDHLLAGHVLAMTFALAMLGLLWGGLRWQRSAGTASAALLTLLATPAFLVNAGGQLADVPLSLYMLGVGILLIANEQSRDPQKGFMLLAGMCSGCALWTKNEGTLLAIVTIGAVFLVNFRDGKRKHIITNLRWLLLGAAVWIACLVLMKSTLAGKSDLIQSQTPGLILHKIMDLDRHKQILSFTLGVLGLIPDALIIALLLLLGLLARWTDLQPDDAGKKFKRIALVAMMLLPMSVMGMALVGRLMRIATVPTSQGQASHPLFVQVFMLTSAACLMLIFGLCFYAVFNRGAGKPMLRPLGLILVGMIAGYDLVYLTTPHDLLWHLSTSIERLFMQLWPSMIFMLFMVLPTSEEVSAGCLSQSTSK